MRRSPCARAVWLVVMCSSLPRLVHGQALSPTVPPTVPPTVIDADFTLEPPEPAPSAAPKAAARSTKPAADFYLEAGEAAYVAGRYEQALPAFEAAYARHKDPGTLFRIAETADKLGRRRRALAAYQEYLQREPQTHDRVFVESRIRSNQSVLAGSIPQTPAATDKATAIVLAPVVVTIPKQAFLAVKTTPDPPPSVAPADALRDRELHPNSSRPSVGPIWLWAGAGALALTGIIVLAVGLGASGTSTPDRVQGNLGRAVQTLATP
jgi:tetratricopeptide (TPR) repeat protein